MKWLFFILTLCAVSRDERLQQIDAEIEQLQAEKRGFEGRALRQEDLANYLQFNNQAWLETRRHQEMAAEQRRNAALVQIQIDHLEEEKKKLQKNGFFS